jgi:hypothetical protein
VCAQTIKVPLDGDPAKVKKFAEDVEGLKKKVSTSIVQFFLATLG